MTTLSIDVAQNRLRDIVAALSPGEEVCLTEDGCPVATVTRTPRSAWPCQAGSAKQTSHWMAPDFDAPLDDFREYMQ